MVQLSAITRVQICDILLSAIEEARIHLNARFRTVVCPFSMHNMNVLLFRNHVTEFSSNQLLLSLMHHCFWCTPIGLFARPISSSGSIGLYFRLTYASHSTKYHRLRAEALLDPPCPFAFFQRQTQATHRWIGLIAQQKFYHLTIRLSFRAVCRNVLPVLGQ